MQRKHLKKCWKNRISRAMEHKDRDISDLIPDYCNNRLDAKEKADFERLLREDEELLEEYNDFQEFQKLYRQADPVEPAPSDAIFDQISNQVSAQQKAGKVEKAERRVPAQSSPLVESLRNYWQQIRESLTVPWMFAAVQAVVIVLLLMPATKQDTYSTLSATDMAANAETIGINVVFQPNALESDIRSLLHTVQGSVSGGPSKEGRYVVSLSSGSDLDGALQTLKQSEIVLFAEPVY